MSTRSNIPPMRPLVFTVASFVLSIAVQLTMAKYGSDIPDVCLLVLWIAPLAPLAWWLWTHEKLLRSRERLSQYVRLHFWKSLATVIIMTLCIWGLGYTGWRILKQRHQNALTVQSPQPAPLQKGIEKDRQALSTDKSQAPGSSSSLALSENTKTEKKRSEQEQRNNGAVGGSQPTYSVTNPIDSIVNQNSPNYGQQTIVHNDPSKMVATYDCGGARHMFIANPMNIDAEYSTEESAAFEKMGNLANSRQYRELVTLCDEQIATKRDAEWLTPYAFRAYAEFQMGEIENARQTLAYYDAHKPSDFEIGACKQVSEFMHSKLK
jgi:hypothetical protein